MVLRVYSFKAPPELVGAARRYAESRGMTLGEVVRRALAEYLARHDTGVVVTPRIRLWSLGPGVVCSGGRWRPRTCRGARRG